MFYYKVKINSMPRIEFACSTSTTKYKNFIQHRKNLLEISTIDGAGVFIEMEGQKIYVPPKSVIVSFPDVSCRIYAEGEQTVFDDSIAMRIDDFEYSRVDEKSDFTGDFLINENVILLPYTMQMGDNFMNVSRLMRTFISSYIQNNSSSSLRCISLWFELLETLNAVSRNSLIGNDEEIFLPSSHAYVRKAKKIINARCCERIKVSDVASELRITPNYLSNMFKQITGKTVLDFINIARIQKARELLSEKVPITKVAEMTGVGSARYLRALFKKYYGVNIHQFSMISNEISLFHQKPWDVDDLKNDLIKT